ncbi:MAG: ABC transporter ATP-binding protein [Bacteroidetes bacterium]|nr:MAG: ABC transporter ATP-binding protein [Bacteroidota bacterium]
MGAETILEIKQLRKSYKDVVALQDLSLDVKQGQVFGLLGPNGSGKTTTLGILLGVLKSDSGSFSWFSNGTKDENRRKIGALLETPNFYPYMSAVDNLAVVARIKGMSDYQDRIEEVLKRVNLHERKNSKFKTFSLGMKQRLAIASAMLSDPEVMVLDEPTNGLDPEGIAEIRVLIQEIAKEGKTIIIASHILDEIEKICTHVAILKKGELLQIGTLDEIMTQDRILMLKSEDSARLKEVIMQLDSLNFIREVDQEIMISVDDHLNPADINKKLVEHGIYLSGIREHRKNLESTFLEIVK